MPTHLAVKAVDQSTFIVTAEFFDHDDNPVTPNDGVTWMLTNADGTVVNNRDSVDVTEAESVDIVLSGDDLKVEDGPERVLTMQGEYSSTYGVLTFKDQVKFSIDDLLSV